MIGNYTDFGTGSLCAVAHRDLTSNLVAKLAIPLQSGITCVMGCGNTAMQKTT